MVAVHWTGPMGVVHVRLQARRTCCLQKGNYFGSYTGLLEREPPSGDRQTQEAQQEPQSSSPARLSIPQRRLRPRPGSQQEVRALVLGPGSGGDGDRPAGMFILKNKTRVSRHPVDMPHTRRLAVERPVWSGFQVGWAPSRWTATGAVRVFSGPLMDSSHGDDERSCLALLDYDWEWRIQ